MVPADSRKIPRVPRYSGYHYASFSFEYRTITVYGFIFQRILLTKVLATSWSYNPNIAVTTLVWANPRSLATTYGITFVFFSSAYLDVSVQRVCPLSGNTSSMYWVAPFGYRRINSCVPIPVAFRSLSRPSSPLRAKASPIRPYFAYVPPNSI